MTTALPHDEPPGGRSLLPRLLVLVALAVGAAVAAVVVKPFPQKLAYHDFADQRALLGVNHFYNVVSNFPFVIVGVLGLWFVLGIPAAHQGRSFLVSAERWSFVLFFLGIFLTGFGSAYYHLQPNNDRLLWDRLPMTIAFMSLFSAVLAERIDVKVGLWLLPVLVTAGLASALYWHWTELQGRGDLRFYYLVQFYPMVALPVLLFFFPPRYTRTIDLVVAVAWYIVAKVCEHPLDKDIFALGGVVSGHTLKHLAAGLSAYWVLLWVRGREPIFGQDRPASAGPARELRQ
jgi:Ceramidase